MKKILLFLTLLAFSAAAKPTGTYKIVVEGFDWGAGVNKVILALNDTTSKVNAADYTVFASRKSSTGLIADPDNKREIVTAYVSDESGARVKTGKNITLVLAVGSQLPISSPFQYQRSKGNVWVDYSLTIVHPKTGYVWDTSTGKIMPLIDQFDLSGKYTYSEKLTMSYATFTPKVKKDKAPLIIWLHGGGEGGTDPTVPLLGNKAANYAGTEIQTIFDGGTLNEYESEFVNIMNQEATNLYAISAQTNITSQSSPFVDMNEYDQLRNDAFFTLTNSNFRIFLNRVCIRYWKSLRYHKKF